MTDHMCITSDLIDTKSNKENFFKSAEEGKNQIDETKSKQKYSKFVSKVPNKVQNQNLFKKRVFSQEKSNEKEKDFSFHKNFLNPTISKKHNPQCLLQSKSQIKSKKLIQKNCVHKYTYSNYSSYDNQIEVERNKREIDITVPNPSLAEPSMINR